MKIGMITDSLVACPSTRCSLLPPSWGLEPCGNGRRRRISTSRPCSPATAPGASSPPRYMIAAGDPALNCSGNPRIPTEGRRAPPSRSVRSSRASLMGIDRVVMMSGSSGPGDVNPNWIITDYARMPRNPKYQWDQRFHPLLASRRRRQQPGTKLHGHQAVYNLDAAGCATSSGDRRRQLRSATRCG